MKKEPKFIKCKGIGYQRREKLIQGNIIHDEFDFLDEENMEIVKLKTALSSPGVKVCPETCFFKSLQPKSAEYEKISKIRTPYGRNERGFVHHSKTWPCYLHACPMFDTKKIRNSDGSLAKARAYVHYVEVSREKIEQES